MSAAPTHDKVFRVPGSISRKDQSRMQPRRNLHRSLNYSQEKETFLASSAARLTAKRSCGGPSLFYGEPTSLSPPLRQQPPPPTRPAPNRHRGLRLLRQRYVAQGVSGGECKTGCESRRAAGAGRISQLAIRSLTISPSTEDRREEHRYRV